MTEKKGDSPQVLFKKLYEKALSLGVDVSEFEKLDALKELKTSQKSVILRYVIKVLSFVIVALFLGLFVVVTEWPINNTQLLTYWFDWHGLDAAKEPCLAEMIESIGDFVRPPVDCTFCEGVHQIDRLSNITPELFELKYAYSGRPVIITDATQNWTAPKHFSFNFFKQIYEEGSPALENVENNCQFFPYKTAFNNLGEVFNMSESRINMTDGSAPWYIGWSNCDFSAANELRNHYSRPYFLPKAAESSKTDWIFMGCPGHGAALHIDNVGSTSWQAQITGRKRWTLEPPPECYYRCSSAMHSVLTPGDIIVVDTDKWYHSTLNVGDDISITIGSEYD